MDSPPRALSLGRPTVLLLAGRLVRFALALAVSVVVARSLGVDGLGAYAYAMGLAAVFGLLPNMGVSTVLTRIVARRPDAARAALAVAVRAQLLLCAGVLVVIPAIASALPGQPVPLAYVALAAGQLALGALSWPYLAVLSGEGRFERVALVELVAASMGAILVGLAAIVTRSVPAVLAAHVLAAGASTVAAIVLSRPVAGARSAPVPTVRALLREAVPFGATAAADGLYNRIDILLLGQLAPTAAVGLYNVASKPTSLLVYLGGTIAGPLFPALARSRPGEPPPPSFRFATRALAAAGPALALALTAIAEPLVVFLYGAEYRAAAPVLALLAWSAAARWAYAPLGVALQATGRERGWLACLLAGLGANVALNLWAIPRWQAAGAAAATLASELVLLGLGGALLLRHLRLPAPAVTGCGIALAAAAGAGVLVAAASRSPAERLGLALAADLGLLFALRIARLEDVKRVAGWLADAVPRRRATPRPGTASSSGA